MINNFKEINLINTSKNSLMQFLINNLALEMVFIHFSKFLVEAFLEAMPVSRQK